MIHSPYEETVFIAENNHVIPKKIPDTAKSSIREIFFIDIQGFWDDRVAIPYSLRAFQNGLESVKLDGLRQCAIQSGMRIVGERRFRRLSAVW